MLPLKKRPWLALDRASLDVLKVIFDIDLKIHKIIVQPWCRLPRNSTVGVYVPHRISNGFEFSQHFCRNQLTGSCGRHYA